MKRRLPLVLVLALLAACASEASEGREATPPEAPTVTIEYIAHASFVVSGPDGSRVLIDPFASRVWLGYDFPVGVTADAVLVTHPHYDHDAGVFRGAEFPWPQTRVIRDPGVDSVGSMTIIGVEGRHADPYGKEFGQTNTIFVIETGGLRIAHLGDNGPLTEENIRQIGTVDVLMIPADGLYHILSLAATDAVIDALAPKVVIPMHYRIGVLEADPESPSGLGDLEPWIARRGPVRRHGGSVVTLQVPNLPDTRTYFVLGHSPLIAVPIAN